MPWRTLWVRILKMNTKISDRVWLEVKMSREEILLAKKDCALAVKKSIAKVSAYNELLADEILNNVADYERLTILLEAEK